MTTYTAVFLPSLTVEDGRVDVDFIDCYSHTTVTKADGTWGGDVEDDPTDAGRLIDAILGLGDGATTAERLRRLADFIERQAG